MAAVPSHIWRMLDQRVADKPLARGLDAAWDAGVGLAKRCVPRLRRFLERAEAVVKFEKQFSDMSNAQLREAIEPLREIFRRHRDTPEDLDRAFALIREVAMRQIGERPFPVQVAGAFALESGCVAEMATGEGKTLTATMPATVAGWRGHGCHIITVNDYLAKRDAEWMGRIYHFCGLKVAHVEQGMLDRTGAPPTRPTSPTARTRRSRPISCATGSCWAVAAACRRRCSTAWPGRPGR